MPTAKPRLTLNLNPEQSDLYRRLADLQRTSMAKVVMELLEQVEPSLREIVAALEAAQAAKGKPAAKLIAAMGRLQHRMQDLTEHAVDQADMFSGRVSRTTAKLKKSMPAKRVRKPLKASKRATG